MAVVVKFRAPYIFHRDSALEVHAWARLVKVLRFSRSDTGDSPKRNGMNVGSIFLTLNIKIFHFKN